MEIDETIVVFCLLLASAAHHLLHRYSFHFNHAAPIIAKYSDRCQFVECKFKLTKPYKTHFEFSFACLAI